MPRHAESTVGMTYNITFSPLSKPRHAWTQCEEGCIVQNVMVSRNWSVAFIIYHAFYSFIASIPRFGDNNYCVKVMVTVVVWYITISLGA